MSMKSMRLGITLPAYVVTYIDELSEELECSRSEVIECSILYAGKNEDDFLSLFELGDDEDEDEDEDLDEDEEDEE